ncbi:NAD-dependent epimerase/dehydratase family protein [Dictyobacter arantiisoli]|uniref:UDP-glucose 4-epimerase n=1 Tax=Dictyobacter arantiisoli TaxID=2014874 RepID=A0A5A5TAZ1_9CHLR|nr:NAD-dependent epimerase/dehydratase family protein [Dictyobacter arantiisoli]GCF08592.1 UDP-glucose 4-epimerase [Dictyobacter arantiisoli]
MKIAIIGGAGFVGSHLTKAYLDAGHDVFVLDNLSSGSRQAVDPRARFYSVDIRDHKLQDILHRERPDVVSHHATQRHETGTGAHTLADADVHVRGLINVLDSCVNASVKRFIFASGGNNLYGQVDAQQLPLIEDMPLHPRSAQAISKVAGEWYIRYYTQQYGIKHTILRYADIYGETELQSMHHPLSHCIQMLHQMQQPIIHGNGAEIRDHIFIDDVIEANLQILKRLPRSENRTFHISSGQGSSLNQLYHLAASMQDSHLEPLHLLGSHLALSSIILDNTRARQALDWQPQTSLPEGIRQATLRLLPRQNTLPRIVQTPQPEEITIPARVSLTHA